MKKELIFIVAALILAYFISNPCLEYDDFEPDMCINRYHANLIGYLLETFKAWIILRIGQWLGWEMQNWPKDTPRGPLLKRFKI